MKSAQKRQRMRVNTTVTPNEKLHLFTLTYSSWNRTLAVTNAPTPVVTLEVGSASCHQLVRPVRKSAAISCLTSSRTCRHGHAVRTERQKIKTLRAIFRVGVNMGLYFAFSNISG